jgi:hypothetical protein
LAGIRLAQVAEPSVVQEIDRASARMFNDVGMPEISRLLWPLEALAVCRAAGWLWVITGCDDRPAGFLVTDVVDGCSHLEQVSVTWLGHVVSSGAPAYFATFCNASRTQK